MIIVEIAGFLGADAEERFTSTGKRVVSLRVAARTRQGGGKQQEGESHHRQGGDDTTMWWRVSIWGDRYDKMLPYLKKGSSVIIIGEMQKPEMYTAKDGSSQISLSMTAEILKFSPFGRPDRERTNDASTGMMQGAMQEAYATQGAADAFGASGDDLPF